MLIYFYLTFLQTTQRPLFQLAIFFFIKKTRSDGRKPCIGKKSFSKVLQITGKCDLVNIWRVRNPSSTRFTFRKSHFSGFLQRRLDYIFISNSVQESVENIEVLPYFCSYHSSLLLLYKKHSHSNLLKMKKHIENIITSFDINFNYQMKWEFFKI